MCQFFSAIVLKNGDVLWHEATDSHSDLVRHFALPDNTHCRHFAKVEFTPAAGATRLRYEDVDKYTLRVDEGTAPGWFADVERSAEKKLRAIVGGMIVTGRKPLVLGGCRILVDCDVDEMKAARVIAMLGSSNVGVMRESSNVGMMLGSSNVGAMWGSSKVGEMRGSSKVGEMWESSKVGEMWESSKVGVMRESSKVGVMRESSKAPKAPTNDHRAKEPT
jgi:hypothetical protein